jgi:hypothetical protein
MSHKRKGQLTVSGEWARHLRPFLRRVFWKGERQAEKAYARSGAEHTEATTLLSNGTLEDLLAVVAEVPTGSPSLLLWVPEALTHRGLAVTQDLALAIILDKVLEKGLLPNGFERSQGGRMYKYDVSASGADA